jgi:hypothetical protein
MLTETVNPEQDPVISHHSLGSIRSRMVSSGMLRRVALVHTDVWGVRRAAIIRV